MFRFLLDEESLSPDEGGFDRDAVDEPLRFFSLTLASS